MSMQEKEKFNEFYRNYENFMYYIAYDVLKDEHLAEDAVQTAFVKMYKNFHKIDEIVSNETKYFVATVTKRTAIDMYRQRKRQKMREPSLEEIKESASSMDVESMAEADEVTACVRRIPKKYADVLVLRYVEGYNAREIAELLGSTSGTIRSCIFRGKKLLREELKKSGLDIRI